MIIFKFIAMAVIMTTSIPSSQRAEKAMDHHTKRLQQEFTRKNLAWGSELYIRIFKLTSELEVWVKRGNQFNLFNTYKICTFSGQLGPKVATGDFQSPEGFYFVKPNQLNPWSRFHLSFNLGYPNKYDRAHGRTGSALMVHGDCVSVGCYAMTDPVIEEVYSLMVSAFQSGQPFIRVHAFPFRMHEENMDNFKHNKWYSFWQNLKVGHDIFEQKLIPPNTEVLHQKYIFN